MDEGVRIRAYERADAGALAALFHAAARGTAPLDYTQEQVHAWSPSVPEARKFAVRCAARPTWVALRGESIAGFADLERDGHVDMLFVHPDHQRRGVARALLDFVEAEARARRLGRLYTEASITARPVFEKAGFRILVAQRVMIRGVALDNFRMEKLLADIG